MPNPKTAYNAATPSNLNRSCNKLHIELSGKNPNIAEKNQSDSLTGIHLIEDTSGRMRMLAKLHQLNLLNYVKSHQLNSQSCVFELKEHYLSRFIPNFNTIDLSKTLSNELQFILNDVESEIIFSMLGAPQAIIYSTFEEFESSIRVRVNIVDSAMRSQLSFETSKAERPDNFWVYKESVGYTLIPGKSLIAALTEATQPDSPNATLYAFSCYRATEYVILLAIAQELAVVNPNLYRKLQRLWERRPIKSGEYHDVFLNEYGSFEKPIPIKYYIPGDRVWFRNPDQHSANVSGYEGSWVIYLGNGLFSNFWKFNQHYTFTDKCIEIYHWRNATYLDEEGELRINESLVENYVTETKKNPNLVKEILQTMAKPREPKNVYRGGGCADISREFPKAICVGTATIKIPNTK